MLRSKHVLPFYNGARAVLLAGSTPAHRHYPPDSGFGPQGSASGLDDSSCEQQNPPSTSSAPAPAREIIALSRTIESVIGPKTPSQAKPSHASNLEKDIHFSASESHSERGGSTSNGSSAPSSSNIASLPSVSEQVFKQGALFHGNSTIPYSLSSLGKESPSPSGYSSFFSSNACYNGMASPPVVSPDAFLQSKKIPYLNLPSLGPSSVRELMHPVANSYRPDLRPWKENSSISHENVLHNHERTVNDHPHHPKDADVLGTPAKAKYELSSDSSGRASSSLTNFSNHSYGSSNPKYQAESPMDQNNQSEPTRKPNLIPFNTAHLTESRISVPPRQLHPHIGPDVWKLQQSNVDLERSQANYQLQYQHMPEYVDHGSNFRLSDSLVQNQNQNHHPQLQRSQKPFLVSNGEVCMHPGQGNAQSSHNTQHYDQSISTNHLNNIHQSSYPLSSVSPNQLELDRTLVYRNLPQSFVFPGENSNQIVSKLSRKMDAYMDDMAPDDSIRLMYPSANFVPPCPNSTKMFLFPPMDGIFHSSDGAEFDETFSVFHPYPLPPSQNLSSNEDPKNRSTKQKSHYYHSRHSTSSSPSSSSSSHSSSHSSKNTRKNRSQNETVKAVCSALDKLRLGSLHRPIQHTPGGQHNPADFNLGLGTNLNLQTIPKIPPIQENAAHYRAQIDSVLSKWHGTLNVYNACDVLKQQEDADLALVFFEWAKKQPGYRADVFLYTTLIGILGKEKKCEEVENLLSEMKREGCHPTVVTYNRLIHSYGRANLLSEALSSFNRMISSGLKPDFVTYSSLIDIYSKAGLHKKALEVYEEMKKNGMKPDVIVYTMILNSYGKMGDLNKALSTFREIKSKGFRPNLVAYNTIIDLFGKSGDSDMAMMLFNEMKSIGLQPDLLTYSTVVDMCGKNGRLDDAENLFSEMLSNGLSGDSIAWSSLVQMWGRVGNTEKAVMWFEKMIQAGCTPTVPAFNTLLCTFVKAQLFSKAKMVLNVLREGGMKPSLMTYTLLLSSVTECNVNDDLKSILDLMKSAKHPIHGLLQLLLSGKANEQRENGIEAEGDGSSEVTSFGMTLESDQGIDGCESAASDSRLKSMQKTHEIQFSENAEVWEKVKKHLYEIRTEDLETKRSFSDAVINFLYKFGKHYTASRLWKLTFEQNFWTLTKEGKKPNTFTLNLHSMSLGTAITVIKFELNSLRELAFEVDKNGGSFPSSVEIITGWGKRSKVTGSSAMKEEVEDFLNALNSPFLNSVNNAGLVYANGYVVQEWLKSSHVAESLMLKDESL